MTAHDHKHDHNHCIDGALLRAKCVCDAHAVRFTAHREQAFKVLWQSHKAMTAAEVMHEMGTNQPPIAYRALEFLKKYGLIHHIASLNAYVGCTHSEKDHVGQLLICTTCKNVEEIFSTQTEDILAEQASKKGFIPASIHIEMLGTCKNCN